MSRLCFLEHKNEKKKFFYKRNYCYGNFPIAQVMEYVFSFEILILAVHYTEDFPSLWAWLTTACSETHSSYLKENELLIKLHLTEECTFEADIQRLCMFKILSLSWKLRVQIFIHICDAENLRAHNSVKEIKGNSIYPGKHI